MTTLILKPGKVYGRLLRDTKKYWHLVLFGVVGILIGSAVDSALAWAIEPLINQGFINRDQSFIQMLPAIVILVFLVRGVALFVSNYCITRVGRNLVMGYRRQLFDHFLKLPAQYFDQTTSSKLITILIFNVEQLADATTRSLLIVLQSVFLIIGLLIVMITISWKLSLLFFSMVPFLFGIIYYTNKRLRKLNSNVQDTMGDVSDTTFEGVAGFREIRIYGASEQERERFYKVSKQARQRELKVVVTNSLSSALVQMMVALPIAFILYVVTKPNFGMSAGSFGAMVTAMISLARPLKRLTKVNSKIQRGVTGAQSIYQLLAENVETPGTGVLSIDRAKGDIELKGVEFAYSKSKAPALNGINLNIKSGETIALVGRSGSGKTTLVQLLPRFYEPTKGSVMLDGADIADYTLENLRGQFAFVSQNVVLFEGTIASNIAFGSQGATRKDIEKAAKLACVDEFTMRFPEGIDTPIGQNGGNLSGGQRQRIAIARAFLKDAPILVFDEATSALDQHVERMIQKSLKKLAKDRTTIIIAHRLSTVEHVDRILVLSDGKVIEQGKHDDLLAQNGEYTKLYASLAEEEMTASSEAE